jgi:hypothetical protein
MDGNCNGYLTYNRIKILMAPEFSVAEGGVDVDEDVNG